MGWTLITVQFIVSKKHTLKPNYIRKLWEALDKNVTVREVVHVGVRENDWEDLNIILSAVGVGRQVGEEAAVFDILVRRSPMLEWTSATEEACNFNDPNTITTLEPVKM